MNIEQCKMIDLPKYSEDNGSLTPIYAGKHIPFDIKRVYYLYDITGGASRAGHAHKELQQLIVCVMGSFDITLDDGNKKIKYSLNRPYQGLYIPKLIWRDIDNFSSGAICLVLASEKYCEEDYLRNYQEFLEYKKL